MTFLITYEAYAIRALLLIMTVFLAYIAMFLAILVTVAPIRR